MIIVFWRQVCWWDEYIELQTLNFELGEYCKEEECIEGCINMSVI